LAPPLLTSAAPVIWSERAALPRVATEIQQQKSNRPAPQAFLFWPARWRRTSSTVSPVKVGARLRRDDAHTAQHAERDGPLDLIGRFFSAACAFMVRSDRLP
jgi:hypothetical protein